MRFDQQSAIVTGAASGIELAIAERLKSEGARVLSVDKNDEGLRAVDGPTLTVDLTEKDAPAQVAEEARQLFGHVDILVNNAGRGKQVVLEETDDELIDIIISTNLRAVLRVTREVIPLLSRPGGRIINIASIFGEVGFPRTPVYGSSKAAIAQLTRQLSTDLSVQGIRVNAVADRRHRDPRQPAFHPHRYVLPAAYERHGANGPRGTTQGDRLCRRVPCSEDASYVAGQVIVVDGGWLTSRFVPGAGPA